jgi:hypothetical protein
MKIVINRFMGIITWIHSFLSLIYYQNIDKSISQTNNFDLKSSASSNYYRGII